MSNEILLFPMTV